MLELRLWPSTTYSEAETVDWNPVIAHQALEGRTKTRDLVESPDHGLPHLLRTTLKNRVCIRPSEICACKDGRKRLRHLHLGLTYNAF
jgi:hypothetical protein